MAAIHSELRKPMFSIPRTTCEACGPHSFWVWETYVLHSQNEVRSLGSTFILGCGNLSCPFPERAAKPMVHVHSKFRELMFTFPERGAEPMVDIHSGLRKPRLAIPERGAKPRVRTHSGLPKPMLGIPRTRCEA